MKPVAVPGRGDVVSALSDVLVKNAPGLVAARKAGETTVSSPAFRNGTVWIAAVQPRKSYVSYHLMPVYMFPDLLKDISPALRARMQGKGCFNFNSVDPALLKELGALTRTSFARFKKDGPALLAKYEKRGK
jgi:hypothetical protein